jgi:hypothetical protein
VTAGFEDRLSRRLKRGDGGPGDFDVERVLHRAVHIGQRRRLRRTWLLAGTTAVVALLLVAGAVPWWAAHRATPAAGLAAGPPGDGPVRVDMLVNGQLLVAGGGTVAWPAGAGARPWFGYRVPAGWLVESMPAPGQGVDTISLVGGDGRLRGSLPGSGLRVSPDGLLAAWVSGSGDTIVAGHVGGAVTGQLRAPLGGSVLGFWADRVIVARYAGAQHLNVTVSLWDPVSGRLSGSWTVPNGPRLIGASPDGRYPVVLSRSSRAGPYCLVELDPAALAVHASVCLTGLDDPVISPDHRWVTGLNSIGRADPVYDLAALFRTGGRAAPVATGCSEPAGNADLAWEDADTFVLATPAFGADSTRLSAIRCRLGSGTGVLVRDARLPATTEAALILPDPVHAGPQ